MRILRSHPSPPPTHTPRISNKLKIHYESTHTTARKAGKAAVNGRATKD